MPPRSRTVSRREFLKVSVTAGGALLVGSFVDACGEPRPTGTPAPSPTAAPSPTDPPPPPADTPFQPNLFVRIDPDGAVTLAIHRSEMGQGVRTSLAMILAEELDVDLAAVRVEQMDVAPRLNQVTGGSASVAQSFGPLRYAGAAARRMLVAAAAEHWGVPEEECTTEPGEVRHPPRNRHLAYGDLIAIANELPVPTSVTPREPAAYRLLGTSVPRVDGPALLTGDAQFGLDVRVPDMRFAVIARSPVPGGRLVDYDAAEAASVPGVRTVVPVRSGVAVVADNTWAAIRGQAALRITWDEAAAGAFSTASIRRQLARALDRTRSAEPVPTSADLEAVYQTPFLAHAPMEPPNCVAHARADRCEIWAPTQNPLAVKTFVQEATGLETDVHVTLLGGGFGRKLEVDYAVEAAEVSQAAGVPVQLVWTREDDVQHDFYRQITRHRMRAGWDADGTLRAWRHAIAAPGYNGLAYRDGVSLLEAGLDVGYEIPDKVSTPSLVETPVPTGPWRALMSTPNAFANECFMDEVAARLGRDPRQPSRNAQDMQRQGGHRLVASPRETRRPGPYGTFRWPRPPND